MNRIFKWKDKIEDISKLVIFCKNDENVNDLAFLYKMGNGDNNEDRGTFYLSKENSKKYNKLLDEIREIYILEGLFESEFKFDDDLYYSIYNHLFNENVTCDFHVEKYCNIICQVIGIHLKCEMLRLDNTSFFCKGKYLVANYNLGVLHDVEAIEDGVYLCLKCDNLSFSQAEEYLKDYCDKFLSILKFILPYYNRTYADNIFPLFDSLNGYNRSIFAYFSDINCIEDINNLEIGHFLIDLDEVNKMKIFERLYHIVFLKKQKNEIENRICDVIKWSSYSVDEKLNFLTHVIALERLLSIRSDSDLVNPSITNSIADAVAFICFENIDERLNTVKSIKEFYSIRSKLAHGNINFDTCLATNFNKLKDLLFNCINKLLLDKRFLNIRNNDELYKWIQIKKYEQ